MHYSLLFYANRSTQLWPHIYFLVQRERYTHIFGWFIKIKILCKPNQTGNSVSLHFRFRIYVFGAFSSVHYWWHIFRFSFVCFLLVLVVFCLFSFTHFSRIRLHDNRVWDVYEQQANEFMMTLQCVCNALQICNAIAWKMKNKCTIKMGCRKYYCNEAGGWMKDDTSNELLWKSFYTACSTQ